MRAYTMQLGRNLVDVPERNARRASQIDRNRDGCLQTQEIAGFLTGSDPEHPQGPVHPDLLHEFQCSLAGLPNDRAQDYHSYAQLSDELHRLAEEHPDTCELTSLGKTAEGRDLWALRISQDVSENTGQKTGLVVTGCHHAREWMTVEAPLQLAHDLLDHPEDDECRHRLEKAEVWILPCVNPDGYEYSRSDDNWWRKNRRPLEADQLGNPTSALGVDLNRNYDDGVPAHAGLYRAPEDRPGQTEDDMWATSDDPDSETYRGPQGASEIEVRKLQELEIGHPNIKGCLDYHSYGDTLLFPWGHTQEHSPNYDLYQEIGGKMAEVSGYTLQQSVGMYPTVGTSDGIQEANGVLSFTIEMGPSFQPAGELIPEISEKVSNASLVFLDELISRNENGTLPQHQIYEVPRPAQMRIGRA